MVAHKIRNGPNSISKKRLFENVRIVVVLCKIGVHLEENSVTIRIYREKRVQLISLSRSSLIRLKSYTGGVLHQLTPILHHH